MNNLLFRKFSFELVGPEINRKIDRESKDRNRALRGKLFDLNRSWLTTCMLYDHIFDLRDLNHDYLMGPFRKQVQQQQQLLK